MNHYDKSKSPYHKILNKQKYAPNSTKAHTFNIYNPELLSFNNTQFKIERAKEELMKLKNYFHLQKKKLNAITSVLETRKLELTKNFMVIQSIMQMSQQNKKRNDDRLGAFEEEEERIPLSSGPIMNKQKDYILMSLIEQHNSDLENQIIVKDNELSDLNQSEKVARYNKLNNNYNSNSIQLLELKKNYDLLRLQYDELAYRLSKTLEERNRNETLSERYKMYCASLFNTEKDDLSNNQSKSNSIITDKVTIDNTNNQGVSNEDRKSINNLKKENDKLRKQIMELNYLNKGYIDKANSIQKQINTKDNDINQLKSTMDKSECDINKVSSNPTTSSHNTNELSQIIYVVNNEIETSKTIYQELYNDYNYKQNEINKKEIDYNDLENELDKHKTQNMALDEILQEQRITVINLQDIDRECKVEIDVLEKELKELKNTRYYS